MASLVLHTSFARLVTNQNSSFVSAASATNQNLSINPAPIPSSVRSEVNHNESRMTFNRSHFLPLPPFRGRFEPITCAGTPVASGSEGGVTEVEDAESLERIIQEAGNKMVLVNVSTKTCGPCKLIYPKVVKMSMEYPDAIFLKINGDLNSNTRALMRKWGVRAVPNFRIYLNGKLIHSHIGASEDDLRSYFLSHYMATIQV